MAVETGQGGCQDEGAMVCHHYCNEPLRCPECVKRFWKWAQSHTRGRERRGDGTPSFYEAAAKFTATNDETPG